MDGSRSEIRVAVIDESDLVVSGVASLLNDRIPRFEVVDDAASADIALIDPVQTGQRVPIGSRLRWLRSEAAHVALFSWKINPVHELLVREHQLAGAISKGAHAAVMAAAFERISIGEQVLMLPEPSADNCRLAPRETQCLQLLSRGLTNREIGHHLNVSPETVKTVLSRSYAKIGARNRAQAAAWAIRAGFADAA